MLNDQQLKDIERLQATCEKYDKCQLKLNGDMLRSRQTDLDDFLDYKDGELIGFLGLYGFGSSYELCGMVHPEFRQKGIFKGLFNDAVLSLKERGVKKLLINTPEASKAGKELIATLSAEYSFSEYQMKWQTKDIGEKNADVQLIISGPEDRELIMDLDYLCFNVERNDSLDFIEMVNEDKDSSSFIIVHEGKKVGKIHVQSEAGRSYIYGFAVHPSQQGKGIGRKVLENIVIQESKAGKEIFLEVAAKNANALRLYEGTGFVSYQIQDYFNFKEL
ncbi:GNAT family N-acetyltransferase [Bacillus sp. AK031]